MNREPGNLPSFALWGDVDQDSADDLNRRLEGEDADYIVLLEGSARILPGALEAMGAALGRFPSDLAYGDSVLQDARGRQEVRRPVFSPLRLREQNYLGPLLVIAIEWLRSIGGFLERARGAHAYSIALRHRGSPDSVLRVPGSLAIETPGDQAGEAAEAAVVEPSLRDRGTDSSLERRSDGSRHVRYLHSGAPLISILIPTRGTTAKIAGTERVMVVEAVRSVVERSTYSNYEIVVIADDETPDTVCAELRAIAGARVRLVSWSEPFNFSRKINRAALHARGDFFLLLNDDVEVISPDWLETMLGLAQQPTVGIVGCLLLFEDGTVQHGGHLYRDSWAGHIAAGWPVGRNDLLGSMQVTREVSGVTAACALLAAETFWEVGGLSGVFPGNYNDVDLALKIRGGGLSAIWSPDVRLFHFESKTRDAEVSSEEIDALRVRWSSRLLLDPYWPA